MVATVWARLVVIGRSWTQNGSVAHAVGWLRPAVVILSGATTNLVARTRAITTGIMKAPTERMPSRHSTISTAIIVQATGPLQTAPATRRRWRAKITTSDTTRGTATMTTALTPLT